MPKGTQLSDSEKGKIVAFRECGLSGWEISKRIKRSKTVVYNFLKNPGMYGMKKRTGRPEILTRRQKRRIVRRACEKKETANEVRQNLSLPCSTRTVQNVLSKHPQVSYGKFVSRPPLTNHHKKRRVDFAKKYISLGQKWADVIFSDEKKFNLDGPDGFRYFWYDLRKTKEVFSRRQFGGGSVMVWGAFAANGTTPIVFINRTMNSDRYVDMLGESLLPEAPLITSGDYIFQQDNASIHVSTSAKLWFEANSVNLLDWPARSPDLNPIENLWGLLAREVYKNGTQYHCTQDLVVAIEDAWEKISVDTLKDLSGSMTSRLIQVIEKKGSFLDY